MEIKQLREDNDRIRQLKSLVNVVLPLHLLDTRSAFEQQVEQEQMSQQPPNQPQNEHHQPPNQQQNKHGQFGHQDNYADF